MSSDVFAVRWNNHSETILSLLASVKNKNTFADGIVACSDKFFPIHKLVLSSCSDYFHQIFELTGEKNSVIVLKDVSPDTFEALLSYMYDGKVDVTKERIPELIKAATALKIKGLALASENQPEDLLTENGEESNDGSQQEHSAKETNIKRPINETDSEDSTESKPKAIKLSSATEQIVKLESQNHRKSLESEEESATSTVTNNMESNEELGNQNVSGSSSCNSSFSLSASVESNRNEMIPKSTNIPFNDPLQIACILAKYGASVDDESMRTKLTDSINLVFKGDLSAIHSDVLSLLALHYATESNAVLYSASNSGDEINKTIYTCPQCDYKTFCKQYFTQHIRRHTGEKPYACSLCDYRASQRQSITYHMRTHTGERPYPCPHCKYSSSSRQNLERHIRRHTGEMAFGCPYCSYKSITKNPVLEHMKVRHADKDNDKSLVVKLSD